METLDFLGEMCPIPILKTKKALTDLKKGESIQIVTDHSCVLQSMKDHFPKPKYTIVATEVINGVWEIAITKN